MPPAPATASGGAVRRLLVAGLGNASHPLTRHSVGQLVVKNLAKRARADPSCLSGSPRLESTRIGKHACFLTRVTLAPPSRTTDSSNDDDPRPLELSFLIPKAPMNINGPSVVAAWENLVPFTDRLDPPPKYHGAAIQKAPPSPAKRRTKPPPAAAATPRDQLLRLVTVQDNLDLAPSVVKYQPGGGPRGHNGVRSVSAALNSTRFHRVWVGIGRPHAARAQVADYVLAPMERDQVRQCEFDNDDDDGGGGEVLERVWQEILRIGFGAS
ncbi:hypothetical protein JCM3774_003482 [Rhodotorula dairenensis]